MSHELEFPEPTDYIIRIPDSLTHDVDYHIFDHSGNLRQNLGAVAVQIIEEGMQPWADFALMQTMAQPYYEYGDAEYPVILDEEGYRLRATNFQRWRVEDSSERAEAIDEITHLHPDLRFTQRDIVFQYELVYGAGFEPRLLSGREHMQVGVFNEDGSYTPFLTILDWAHPVRLRQD